MLALSKDLWFIDKLSKVEEVNFKELMLCLIYQGYCIEI